MDAEYERLQRFAAQVHEWFETKPRSFWSEEHAKELMLFVSIGGIIYCLKQAVSLGYIRDAHDETLLAANIATAIGDLASMLKLEDRPAPGYSRSVHYLGNALVVASAVIEVVSHKNYGNRMHLFNDPLFASLKDERDRVAHLEDLTDIDPETMLDALEHLLPELRAYLERNKFF